MATASLTVFVTHIDDTVVGSQSPQLIIWGRMDQNLILKIDENMKSIRHHLESIPPPLVNLKQLKEVCCFFQNYKWQRARVVNFLLGPRSTIGVICIDSGKTQTITLANLRTLDIPGKEAQLLRDLPPAATKLILTDVIPPYGLGLFIQWSKQDVELLKMHVENRNWKVEHIGTDDGHKVVRLFNSTGEILSMSLIKSLGSPNTCHENLTENKVGRVLDKKAMLPTEFSCFPICVSRIAKVCVGKEETLYVVEAKEGGCFFGQFDNVRVKFLQDLSSELIERYSASPQPPLLYADLKTHEGDYGIIRHNNYFYRVLIKKEMKHEVAVLLVDFGKTELVSRERVYAPVKGLTLFLQSPCGIPCQMETASSMSVHQLHALTFKNTFKFQVGKSIKGNYIVSLTSHPCNTAVAKAVSLE